MEREYNIWQKFVVWTRTSVTGVGDTLQACDRDAMNQVKDINDSNIDWDTLECTDVAEVWRIGLDGDIKVAVTENSWNEQSWEILCEYGQ